MRAQGLPVLAGDEEVPRDVVLAVLEGSARCADDGHDVGALEEAYPAFAEDGAERQATPVELVDGDLKEHVGNALKNDAVDHLVGLATASLRLTEQHGCRDSQLNAIRDGGDVDTGGACEHLDRSLQRQHPLAGARFPSALQSSYAWSSSGVRGIGARFLRR
jgi:hypothetical protein